MVPYVGGVVGQMNIAVQAQLKEDASKMMYVHRKFEKVDPNRAKRLTKPEAMELLREEFVSKEILGAKDEVVRLYVGCATAVNARRAHRCVGVWCGQPYAVLGAVGAQLQAAASAEASAGAVVAGQGRGTRP